ncbi:MAG: polyprenyl synthetase [Bacteroidetes bacterium]|nr:polyprenyl synthetase [Bacteroidota bacterium]
MNEASLNRRYLRLRNRVDRYLVSLITDRTPRQLHEACAYVLTGGGKRLRAALVILSAEAVGGSAAKALPAGAAVEIMHNFTLVHDDIMDHARTRRGRPTVHVRWDLNTALLAGDTLLAVAYEQLLRTDVADQETLLRLFTRSVIGVCEGQALDLEFERRNDITVDDYYGMIDLKTGLLISAAAELGARIGGGSSRDVNRLRTFGRYLGRAFQLQDDLLDVVGDEKQFGKSIGGDILEGKRTFLLLTARERARKSDRDMLTRVLRRKTSPPARTESPAQRRALIATVRSLYDAYGVIRDTEDAVMRNTRQATEALRALSPTAARETLHALARTLVHRES